MREGTQLGVAKAARFPPCTLLYVGRRFIINTVRYCFSLLFISLQEKQSNKRLFLHIVFPHVDDNSHLQLCCLEYLGIILTEQSSEYYEAKLHRWLCCHNKLVAALKCRATQRIWSSERGRDLLCIGLNKKKMPHRVRHD